MKFLKLATVVTTLNNITPSNTALVERLGGEAQHRIDVSIGESVHIIRELQELS